MPAYNFQSRFADPVASGEKRQTIRKPRKRPTRPGDNLKHYTGMRTKQCRLLCEATCKSVEPIRISSERVLLNGKRLNYGEIVDLARADGFADVLPLLDFFEGWYGPDAELELIKW